MYDFEELEKWQCPGAHTIHEEPTITMYNSTRRFSLSCDGIEYAARTFDLKKDSSTDIHQWECWEKKDHLIDWLILLTEKLAEDE